MCACVFWSNMIRDIVTWIRNVYPALKRKHFLLSVKYYNVFQVGLCGHYDHLQNVHEEAITSKEASLSKLTKS